MWANFRLDLSSKSDTTFLYSYWFSFYTWCHVATVCVCVCEHACMKACPSIHACPNGRHWLPLPPPAGPRRLTQKKLLPGRGEEFWGGRKHVQTLCILTCHLSGTLFLNVHLFVMYFIIYDYHFWKHWFITNPMLDNDINCYHKDYYSNKRPCHQLIPGVLQVWLTLSQQLQDVVNYVRIKWNLTQLLGRKILLA